MSLEEHSGADKEEETPIISDQQPGDLYAKLESICIQILSDVREQEPGSDMSAPVEDEDMKPRRSNAMSLEEHPMVEEKSEEEMLARALALSLE